MLIRHLWKAVLGGRRESFTSGLVERLGVNGRIRTGGLPDVGGASSWWIYTVSVMRKDGSYQVGGFGWYVWWC
jgi:hypothetical protein